jgi:hypothetical protein
MTYTKPATRRLTLTSPGSGLPDLVMDRAGDIAGWKRSQVGGYRSGGKTLAGQTKLERAGHKPFYVWTVQLRATRAELAIVERLQALMENSGTTAMLLRDEFEYVDLLKAGWNQRAILTDSTVTINGVGMALCTFPVLLQLDEQEHAKYLGAGRYDLNFSLEEII